MSAPSGGMAGPAPARPVILSVAGSDSGGGAGIQADMKTVTALGAFGVSVLAALTAQNGAQVRGVLEVPVDFVLLQLAAVLDGFPVKAAKTGMLATTGIIEAVAGALGQSRRSFPLVVDPVCMSQSGHRLLRPEAEDAMRVLLLPEADILTPNKPEAELLARARLEDDADPRPLLDRLHALGAKAVLLKGGHFKKFSGHTLITDWLSLPGREPQAFSHARVETVNTHGTGCALSAALAAFLGFGFTPDEAVRKAQQFLSAALASSFTPGIGAGPPDFFAGSAFAPSKPWTYSTS
ncbi:MAG: bifunctional hydroxymethylpyrimidine kinase/phosphomethylpyrimidine kinase [Desulfovibrio sp.]|nr:bifunctional hydroxymethylpyrimidine kinase/phosphomethylpyrimidine kinase [Desulfovibrio sp.]